MSIGRPSQVGPYEIRDVIGHGGMAAVYKAYQPMLDRVVAIKVLSSALAADREFLERFRQEARAAARLTHPNIVTVHDFGVENEVPYLVMEYVDGEDLGAMLHRGLTTGEAVGLISQVAAGLDYAHSRGVVHRDVKPQNVLVTAEGRAVLADFGLARIMESAHRLTLTGGVVGTPEYMSPEQAAGRAMDHRSDVYALAVIAYEALTGARPFSAETPLGVLMKQIQEPPIPARHMRPGLTADVEAVLAQALAKQPDERPQSAGAFARALRAAVEASSSASSAPAVNAGVVAGVSPPPENQAVEPLVIVSRVSVPDQTPGQPLQPRERHCPECNTAIPPNVSICPECTYLLPFEPVAAQPVRKPERRQVRINLLPFNIRWDPPGLERARQLTWTTVHQFESEGWELVSSIEAAGTFTQGRSASGPVVQSATITLQR